MIFTTPQACWPLPKPTPPANKTPSKWATPPEDWRDAARDRRFDHAIICYLWGRQHELVPVWTMLNAIGVEASGSTDREVMRDMTHRALMDLNTLLRRRRVLRKRKKYVVLNDPWAEAAKEDRELLAQQTRALEVAAQQP